MRGGLRDPRQTLRVASERSRPRLPATSSCRPSSCRPGAVSGLGLCLARNEVAEAPPASSRTPRPHRQAREALSGRADASRCQRRPRRGSRAGRLLWAARRRRPSGSESAAAPRRTASCTRKRRTHASFCSADPETLITVHSRCCFLARGSRVGRYMRLGLPQRVDKLWKRLRQITTLPLSVGWLHA